MKGKQCPYRRCLLCEEESGCLSCEVYYANMPVPYDGRTIKEVDQDGNRLFGCQPSLLLDNGNQMV